MLNANNRRRVLKQRTFKALLFISALHAGATYAAMGIGADTGVGIFDTPYRTRNIELDALWPLGGVWHRGHGVFSDYGQVDVSHMHSSRTGSLPDSMNEVGVSAILRWRPDSRWHGFWIYTEVGLGLHLLSHVSLGASMLSTRYQFGPLIGIGLARHRHRGLEIGTRLQHLSNANTRLPNDGLNFIELYLTYWFDPPGHR
jgi:hypothetical protein